MHQGYRFHQTENNNNIKVKKVVIQCISKRHSTLIQGVCVCGGGGGQNDHNKKL